MPSMPGCDSFGISTGPMCSSLRDIDLFMAAIRGGRPETIDPTLYPQPWHVKPLERKLRVGIMRHDGVVIPQPPMLRALDTVARILRESDAVDVVDFAPYKQRFGYDNLVSYSSVSPSVNYADGLTSGLCTLKTGVTTYARPWRYQGSSPCSSPSGCSTPS